MVASDIKRQKRDSVQTLPVKDERAGMALFYFGFNHDGILLPWGTRERDVQLRRYGRLMHTTLFNGAVANLAKDIASTPWELDGGKNNVKYYQELLLSADFSGGWRNFILKMIRDYAIQDRGAFVELTGGGKPDRAIRGRVTGMNMLDPIRCIPTGDPEYPVVYHALYDKKDHFHLLHATRVYRFTDMPSSDERLRDRGLANQGESALSRYFGYYYGDMLMGRYNIERLSDMPPQGLITAANVSDLRGAMALYETDRQREGQGVFRGLLELEGVDPGAPVDVKFIPFSNLPEGFNQRDAVETNARLVALALGVDPQDIMPLTGQAMGSGQQSKVLDDKSRGKTKGDLLRIIERFLNTAVLPIGMEFRFTEPDEEKGKQAADRGQVWVSVVNEIQGISSAQRLKILANNVPEIADVILGEDGTIELPDDDLKADDEIEAGQATDTDMINPAGDAVIEGEFTEVVAEGGASSAVDDKAKQIFAYHLEHGVVEKDEARDRLGFPPSNNPLDKEFRDKHAALKLVQAAVDAQIPLKAALEMAHLDLDLDKFEEKPDDEQRENGAPPFAGASEDDEGAGAENGATPPQPPFTPDREGADTQEDEGTGIRRSRLPHLLKAFPDTRKQFEAVIADVLTGAQDKSINRRRAGVIMRGHLSKFGRVAMQDGLRDAGTPTVVLSDKERRIFNKWLVTQSAFITGALDQIYQNDLLFDANARAKVWANKSLTDIYYKGMLQGDKDPNMKMVGSDGKDSCRTCKRLKGRVYKLSTWLKRKLVPQKDTENYECGGFQCNHKLVRTTEPASKTRLREWMKGYEHDHSHQHAA